METTMDGKMGPVGPAPSANFAAALGLWACFAVLVLGVAVLASRWPLVGLPLAMIAPATLALAVRLAGPWWSAGGGLAALAIAARATSASLAPALVWCALPLATAGLLLGILTRRERPYVQVLALGASGVTLVLMVMWYAGSLHRLTQVWQPAPAQVRMLGPLYEAIADEPLEDHYPSAAEGLCQVVRFWGKFPLFWASVLGLALFGGALLGATRVFAWWGLYSPRADDFARWSIPWAYSWLLIGASAIYLVARWLEMEWGVAVSWNLGLALLLPCTIVSFSVITHVLDRWSVDPPLRLLVFLLALVSLPYLTLACLLDPWLDYRRLLASEPSPEDGPEGD